MYSTKMIIRRVSQAVMAIFLTMALNEVTFGQTRDESVLLGMTEFTIKPGQVMQIPCLPADRHLTNRA